MGFQQPVTQVNSPFEKVDYAGVSGDHRLSIGGKRQGTEQSQRRKGMRAERHKPIHSICPDKLRVKRTLQSH